MKLYILFLLLPVFSFAQSNPGGKPITYEGVVIDSAKAKDILYNNARSWYNNTFRSSKDVLQIQDKESGELSGKGSFKFSYNYYEGYVTFSVKVFVKDGKYKYQFENFVFNPDGYKQAISGPITEAPEYISGTFIGKKGYNKAWVALKEYTDTQVKLLVRSLNNTMSAKAESDF